MQVSLPVAAQVAAGKTQNVDPLSACVRPNVLASNRSRFLVSGWDTGSTLNVRCSSNLTLNSEPTNDGFVPNPGMLRTSDCRRG